MSFHPVVLAEKSLLAYNAFFLDSGSTLYFFHLHYITYTYPTRLNLSFYIRLLPPIQSLLSLEYSEPQHSFFSLDSMKF